jgi:hypothetical protein
VLDDVEEALVLDDVEEALVWLMWGGARFGSVAGAYLNPAP